MEAARGPRAGVDGVSAGDAPLRATAARRDRSALAPSYFRQLWAVVWKDLVVELRSRQRVVAMASFTVMVGILFNYAFDPTLIAPQNVAAGLIWMTVVFTGLLGVGRTFQLEAEDAAFQGVLASPIPKDALYLGKVVSNFVLVGATVLLIVGVFTLFFGLDLGARPMLSVAVVLLGALGFVALATLFAAVSSATSMGETLLPVLLFPLLVPMVIFGASATGALLAGRPFSAVDDLVRVLGGFTLISLLAGALMFRHVVEE